MSQNKILLTLIKIISIILLCYLFFVDFFFDDWVDQQSKETIRLIQRGRGFVMLWMSALCFYSLYKRFAEKEAPIQP
jgi:hypothetical protein